MKLPYRTLIKWFYWIICYKPPGVPRTLPTLPGLLGISEALPAGAKDFYLKEYETLRGEVELLLKESQTIKRETIFAIGVTTAWLFREEQQRTVPSWTWFIPLVFVMLGYSRASGMSSSFSKFAECISRIEDMFSGEFAPGGWEHFSSRKAWSREGFIAFWRLMIFMALGLGFYGFIHYWRHI